MMIENSIKEAATILPVAWPIKSFIATNPLCGLTALSFEEALRHIQKFSAVEGLMPIHFYQTLYAHQKITAADLKRAVVLFVNQQGADQEGIVQSLLAIEDDVSLQQDRRCPLVSTRIGIVGNQDITMDIQTKMMQFFMFYFDDKNTAEKRNGLYKAWCDYGRVYGVKEDVLEVIQGFFQEFNISPTQYVSYISAIFAKLIGWCGLIKWLEQRPDNPFISAKASLVDVVLIWLCYEKIAAKKQQIKFPTVDFAPEEVSQSTNLLDDLTRRLLWQRAFEYAYERELMGRLESRPQSPVSSESACSVQAIFCIDTRSEGLRYALEKMKGYETYGFAGFFGFVFSCQDSLGGGKTLQCPALFAPEATLQVTQRLDLLSQQSNLLLRLLQQTKKALLSPFVWVEIMGYWYALLMLLKSFLPHFFQKMLKRLGQNKQDRLMNAELSSEKISQAFTLEVKVNNAAQFLRAIGLIHNFASLVLICGHGSETDNNPYQASLDCGACGGNAGFLNARVACEVLNDTAVRAALRIKGIDIPDATYFIAGFHNTTRDEVVLSRLHLPGFLQQKIATLSADLKSAADRLRPKRLAEMPGHFSADNRSVYWAELVPEMGLINNAALIIAPRQLTRGVDLSRRTFLHSYDTLNDTEGDLLTAILSGPLVVAHWINAQYYFSTTDPSIYGSGNKMLHNPLGVLGVMEGNFSDLKIGLPWQSVAFRDEVLHQPLRLLVVVYAPQARVDAVLAKNPNIKAIFDGQWAHLKVIEPQDVKC